MKSAFQFASLSAVAVLLAACGGGTGNEPVAPQSKTLAMRAETDVVLAPSAYTAALQSIYVGLFGRPADAGGLAFWSQVFSDHHMPPDLPGLISGYVNNPQIKSTLDGFVASQEFANLYVSNNPSFINTVYQNAFNRNAEASGREFWSGALDRKELSPIQAVLAIVNDAQTGDSPVVAKKIQAAATFTSLLDTPDKVAGYERQASMDAARALLSTITASTDLTAFRSSIDAFIGTLLQTPGDFPVVARYAGYTYLQDMTSNQPVYSANYSYAGGVASPASSGSLTFGMPAQTVSFARTGGAELSYDAALVAAAGIGSGSVLPPLNMLCQSVATPNGNIVKSTDVLVTRSARQLVDAAELANQTFTVYRENCAVGGNNLPSMRFDSQGNGTFPLASGSVLTYNAAAVTAALNGRIQVDLSTGKLLVFSAYRYTRSDGSNGYVIIQHLASHKVGLTDGILAVWSQE